MWPISRPATTSKQHLTKSGYFHHCFIMRTLRWSQRFLLLTENLSPDGEANHVGEDRHPEEEEEKEDKPKPASGPPPRPPRPPQRHWPPAAAGRRSHPPPPPPPVTSQPHGPQPASGASGAPGAPGEARQAPGHARQRPGVGRVRPQRPLVQRRGGADREGPGLGRSCLFYCLSHTLRSPPRTDVSVVFLAQREFILFFFWP